MLPNQWYAVLETDEVKGSQPVSFKRLGQDLVFWRNERGKVVCMDDWCPHRQVKLSNGKVVNGNIECPFHGFQYDSEGACQHIPANGKNGPRPKIFQAKVWPTQEAYGFIWVWNGAKQKEYPPVRFFDEVEGFAYAGVRKHWPVHYSRAIENQLDVAHLPFVHASTIGRGGRTLVNGPYTLIKDDALYVWIDNQLDHEQAALHASEMVVPNKPWGLCFKFPNTWLLNITPKLRIGVAFAPIDEENTMMYVRYYHNFAKNPLLRKIMAVVGAKGNERILAQDARIVFTHQPKKGGLDSGDKYIPADRPLVVYYKHCEKLIAAAQSAEAEALPEIPMPTYANTLAG